MSLLLHSFMSQSKCQMLSFVFLLALLFLPNALSASPLPSDSSVVAFLQRDYGVKFTDNNRVVFFKNGQEKFDDLFCAVKQAKSTVHLEYFNFRNDSISALLFGLLSDCVKRGVKVRAIFDGFGNSSNNRPLLLRHLDTLRARGIEIYEFDPVRFPWINHAFKRDHRKIVVIDGLVAYTGGMNVADYYIKGKTEFGDWRDIHCRVEGDVVGQLQAIFVKFWNRISRQEVSGPHLYPGFKDARQYFEGLKPDTCVSAGRKSVGVVDRVPDETPAIMRETFVESINAAQRQILIINPYFTLNRKIRRALRKALRRGVDVQVMISEKSDIPITPRIVEHEAHRLMKKGATIHVYTGGFHHSKIMMVDSSFCFVGSANLNSRSLQYDYECNLLVDDVPTTEALISIFSDDSQGRCYKLTPELWRKRSWWRRFQCWFFQILTPFV